MMEHMNDRNICQSCGLPFDENHRPHGTEADGNPCGDYCRECMVAGVFCEDIGMAQMVEKALPRMMQDNLGITEEKAREVLSKELYPGLKRWQVFFSE